MEVLARIISKEEIKLKLDSLGVDIKISEDALNYLSFEVNKKGIPLEGMLEMYLRGIKDARNSQNYAGNRQ